MILTLLQIGLLSLIFSLSVFSTVLQMADEQIFVEKTHEP